MIDMVLKNKAGISDTQDLQVFAVFYLIVWDKIYTVHNGIINFNEKVKMRVATKKKNSSLFPDAVIVLSNDAAVLARKMVLNLIQR